MKYEMDLVSHVLYSCEANSREEAIQKANEAYTMHHVDYIADDDGKGNSVSSCTSCSAVIFDDTESYMDGDCNEFCKNCWEELKDNFQ